MSWFGSTEQTISWFRARMNEGSLEIKPPYQRKPIWKLEQKCALIESILLDMPIPEIFMQTTTNEDGVENHAIVDGQQRIRTILHFTGSDPTDSEVEFQNFKLSKLDENSPYYNKSLSDLSAEDRTKFFRYTFTVRTLNTQDDSKIRSVFQRLNKYQSPMLAQELRNAEFSGPFLKLSTELANLDFWTEHKIINADKIRRMQDIEFVSELMFGILLGPQGGNKDIITQLYQMYDAFEDEFPNQNRVSTIFKEVITLLSSKIPNLSKTRWSNKSDFYSLFTYIARKKYEGSEIIDEDAFISAVNNIGAAITQFQEVKGPFQHPFMENIIKYAENVTRGSSEKSRRSARNQSIGIMLNSHFR